MHVHVDAFDELKLLLTHDVQALACGGLNDPARQTATPVPAPIMHGRRVSLAHAEVPALKDQRTRTRARRAGGAGRAGRARWCTINIHGPPRLARCAANDGQ